MLAFAFWYGANKLLQIVLAPRPLPPNAPPAPPPPPLVPDLVAINSDRMLTFAEQEPVSYLLVDFLTAFAIALVVLYWKDITEWLEARAAAARQGDNSRYQPLDEQTNDPETGRGPAIVEMEYDQNQSLANMTAELRLTIDKVEELEIKTKVNRKSTADAAIAMRVELKQLMGRRDELQRIISGSSNLNEQEENEQDGGEAAAEMPAKKGKNANPGGTAALALAKVLAPVMNSLMNTATGVFAIGLYFADILSDVQVVQLMWTTENYAWAGMSVFLLVIQFFIVYLRVLPYLQNTFGSKSIIYLGFVITGFPAGLLLLDCLMFLEPFGLLAILPFPGWMRQFIPAYKATRVIAEILIESLPQSVLQACIYVSVVKHSQAGTASRGEQNILDAGQLSLMPKSILISTLATLKTWIELVGAAREAGLSVVDKGFQLWNVGAGMPLDALKKGAIVEWSCPYELDVSEVSPLLDALSKNGSLQYLNLGKSGIRWNGTNADGLGLVEQMARTPATLSSLKIFVIRDEGYEIPVKRLREPTEALVAIQKAPFFSVEGPRRDEVILMGDLMRKDTQGSAGSLTAETVVKLVSAARGGKLKKHIWEESITRLLCDGSLKRGHLLSLISAEMLRDVNFSAADMLATGHSLATMREGGYLAAELRVIGLKARELGDGGYTPGELRVGGYRAKDLKAANYSARDMKDGAA